MKDFNFFFTINISLSFKYLKHHYALKLYFHHSFIPQISLKIYLNFYYLIKGFISIPSCI